MFLKKVVSWISENPPDENSNEITKEGFEKSLNKSTEATKTDDNWSSTRTEMSTIGESFAEQNEIIDIQRSNKEKAKNDDNGSVSLTISNDKTDNTETETNRENTGCNHFMQERLLIRKSVVNGDAVIEKENTDISAKLNSVFNYELQPSFLKEVRNSENHTTSNSRPSRSIFTQNENKCDEQCDNMVMETFNKYSSVGVSEHLEKNEVFPVSISSLDNYAAKHRPESFYGTLFVVGCSKVLPNHLADKMNTKYTLRKRSKASGLIEANSFVTSADVKESFSATPTKHVILYPSDNHRSLVVTFKHDPLSDLFQIGRYEKHPIDFSVYDISPLNKARNGVSRFACRISVRRDENHEARIYAGAFDSSGTIFVGLAHDYCGKMDGFTTNGVLIYKPNEILPSNWREVSVSGYIYPMRSAKIDVSKRARILTESNILVDGTLIDLCGVTLIWRTPEGLKRTPTEYYLNHLQSTLHKHTPESVLLPRNSRMIVSQVERAVKKCYVFLACGHVTGLAFSKLPDDYANGLRCPDCKAFGPIKEFTVGTEPGFYFDEEAPSYAAFKPCGHVATQKTVEFWSGVQIPNHRNIQRSICPFCGQNLNFITKYVRLALPII